MQHQKVDVLLIEDNLQEAELGIRSLRKHDLAHHLKHIDDGAEALDFIFSRGRYADSASSGDLKLILLDLKLPKVDGLEILRRLKEDEKTRHIPVVVLTSSSEQKDIVESYNLGVNSYIIKPINFAAFEKSITDVGQYWLVRNQPPGIAR